MAGQFVGDNSKYAPKKANVSPHTPGKYAPPPAETARHTSAPIPSSKSPGPDRDNSISSKRPSTQYPSETQHQDNAAARAFLNGKPRSL